MNELLNGQDGLQGSYLSPNLSKKRMVLTKVFLTLHGLISPVFKMNPVQYTRFYYLSHWDDFQECSCE